MSEGKLLREKEIRGGRKEKRIREVQIEPCRYCMTPPKLVKMQSFHRKEGRDEVWRVSCATRKCPGKIYRYYLTPEAAVRAWTKRMQK